MAVIQYTHSYDLLYKILVIIARVILTALTCEILGHIPVEEWLKALGSPDWVYQVLILLTVILLLFFWAEILFSITGAFPAYLYLHYRLSTPVTWREAKSVSFLFQEDFNGKWYPLEDLKKIPKEHRKAALFEFAKRIRPSAFDELNA